MKRQPIAFMSYAINDDRHDGGKLTQFRERLSGEVQMQTGEEFVIFQDRQHILWGQKWKERIEESLDGATFLIPIITPRFFNSPYCRDELQRFLEREQKLNRGDLILPVYYVSCPLLDDARKRGTNELAQVIATRQYADWRDLRFESFDSPQVARRLVDLAIQIREALERTQHIESISHCETEDRKLPRPIDQKLVLASQPAPPQDAARTVSFRGSISDHKYGDRTFPIYIYPTINLDKHKHSVHHSIDCIFEFFKEMERMEFSHATFTTKNSMIDWFEELGFEFMIDHEYRQQMVPIHMFHLGNFGGAYRYTVIVSSLVFNESNTMRNIDINEILERRLISGVILEQLPIM